MKASELTDLSTQELSARIMELKGELFNLRFQQTTGQLANNMAIRECKKNIARVNTILRERELKKAQ